MYPLIVAIVIIVLLILLVVTTIVIKNRNVIIPHQFLKLYSFIAERLWRKRMHKKKMIAMLIEKGSLANVDFRKEINVSDSSIVNYADELEKEGKIEQMGKTGRSVKYRLK